MWVTCDNKSDRSSTYSPVACSAKLCKSYQYSGCKNDTCVVPGRGSDGFELAQDVAALPTSDGSNPGPLTMFFGLAFACAAQEDLFDLPRGTAGVAGMSSSTLSLPAQLSAAAGFECKFSICLSGNGPGVLHFGDDPIVFLPPPGTNLSNQLIQTPLIKNLVYTGAYYIDVQSIQVGGVHVPINAEKLRLGPKGRGGTKLSTVVPYTQLATPIYNSLIGVFTSLLRQMNVSRVASVLSFSSCFDSSVARYSVEGPNGFQTSGVVFTRVGPGVPLIELVLLGNDTTTLEHFLYFSYMHFHPSAFLCTSRCKY